jgi:tetratricopeptide (TPR) repeat protein
MRWLLMVGVCAVLNAMMCNGACGFAPDERVVVIRPVELQREGAPAVPLTAGTILKVEADLGDRLRVAVQRIGTVESSAVLGASKADAHFTALIEANPKDATAWAARGKLRFSNGDKSRAIADFDRVIELSPTAEALTLRGFAWKRNGDPQKAMADLNRAIELDPTFALAWRVRGATWAAEGDYQKAKAHYTESIRLDPDNPESLHHRAVLLSCCMVDDIRDGQQALTDATKACEVTEWKDPLFLAGLAFAYAELGDFDNAVTWQTKVVKMGGFGEDRLLLFKQKKPSRVSWQKAPTKPSPP